VWRGRLPAEFVAQYSHYTKIETKAPAELDLPAHYVAVRFTSGPASGDRPEVQNYVNELVQALAANGPVVALYAGYSVEGPAFEELTLDACEGLISLRDRVGPRQSARLETQVIAGADCCVCTMGGAVPLAVCSGVETIGLYRAQPGFASVHWAVADFTASQLWGSGLTAIDIRQVPARQLADRVRRRRKARSPRKVAAPDGR